MTVLGGILSKAVWVELIVVNRASRMDGFRRRRPAKPRPRRSVPLTPAELQILFAKAEEKVQGIKPRPLETQT
jgi:hypothetical protein